MKKLFLSLLVLSFATSCISTRNTIKNIDNDAPMPNLSKEQTFIINEVSSDSKYGYDPDYPVNLGFLPIENADINIKRYFGALSGPNNEKITYLRVESCCPFPSERNSMGAGLLDIYEVTWDGLAQPKLIYINLYERGKIMAPKGFGVRQL